MTTASTITRVSPATQHSAQVGRQVAAEDYAAAVQSARDFREEYGGSLGVQASEWLEKLNLGDVIQIAGNFTVQQFLARDRFAKRYAAGKPIWVHEFMYGLMQGYDAVQMQTDVQVGGTEQLFNLLAGRKLQESFGQRPQVCVTMPILVGTDGTMRMSKSTGNHVGITAARHRGEVMRLGLDVVVLDDCYNSSPDALAAAVVALGLARTGAHRGTSAAAGPAAWPGTPLTARARTWTCACPATRHRASCVWTARGTCCCP